MTRASKATNRTAIIITAVVVIALLAAGFFWRRFEYRECRTVGHSVLYCLTHDGNGNR